MEPMGPSQGIKVRLSSFCFLGLLFRATLMARSLSNTQNVENCLVQGGLKVQWSDSSPLTPEAESWFNSQFNFFNSSVTLGMAL